MLFELLSAIGHQVEEGPDLLIEKIDIGGGQNNRSNGKSAGSRRANQESALISTVPRQRHSPARLGSGRADGDAAAEGVTAVGLPVYTPVQKYVRKVFLPVIRK